MATPQAGMKKRQIIASSNKTMFLWVAGMSAVVGVCAVIALFLFQQISFKTKVVNEMDKTASTLRDNNKIANELVANVRKLNVNEALISVKANDEEQPLRVVLDALPADNNQLALGASLQQKIIGSTPGVKIETLQMENGDSSILDSTMSANSVVGDQVMMPFRAVVSATDPQTLKTMLENMEKSIRTIDMDSMALERSQDRYTLTMIAHAYYVPEKKVTLTQKVVKP